jgi:MoxR-like ATPase
MDQSMPVERFHELAEQIETEVGKVIVGQKEVVRQVLICILSGGHALLEGVPGLGKTMLIRTLGQVLDLKFSRIQFTPDLMPADITGTEILVDADGRREFRFQPGPVFANLVLADEINRATPKTQSAMLEAMQEHSVTVAEKTYQLDEPFFVLATASSSRSTCRFQALRNWQRS